MNSSSLSTILRNNFSSRWFFINSTGHCIQRSRMSMGGFGGSRGAAFLKAALACSETTTAKSAGLQDRVRIGSGLSSRVSKEKPPTTTTTTTTTKRKRGRPPNVTLNGATQRRGSLHSKNSITTDSPRSESTKNSDSGSATEEETW